MREYPNYNIPRELIKSSKQSYPLCNNIDEALKYLKLITDEEFIYDYKLNYDSIDYRKILYIEHFFANQSPEIAALLQTFKMKVACQYKEIYQYINRISDNIIDYDFKNREEHLPEVHLPNKFF